ncbi:MAG: solute:Na+ symporter, family [Methanolobus sp.]|jgi:SSS family solute:Na+ symporter|uniref:SSS sodium solute transporter n=1 Tax=Methanolobus tindarius DSM 2278 TaxID=1090322 RepID=W9DTF4_METTI|nr:MULTISPECIES: sodium:solute symporter family protein [Methanolobus]ETA66706.1 SSS sodium solute transporter [Methanolobus tindarius DSM 2278]MDI3485670.1 solute:Na+ symporter, family [Methanolobus sp.]MDK2830972.1 solute:Na+ symporter, family [Methanolobus sp.]MDK2938268.1 solute:Na+ symporter, family [Methanolobus sp.]
MVLSTPVLGVIILIYLMVIFYLGWLGYKKTKQTEDYMVAGRQIHPYILALSYGATFISTSAIIGFGGAAGALGMGLLWLAFMNIFVGIFIAFVLFGSRTRRMGLNLGAVTFPELLGRRFQSRFIQGFSGALIGIFMPLYAGIVLIGGARFLESTLNINYDIAVLILTVIVAAYVITGGLIAVMYTDALQGTLMFIGMAFLLVFTYIKMGGVTAAHSALTAMNDLVPESLAAGGHLGWTSMPAFGSPIWWTLVSTLVLGVGIGVVAQPQLAVRFMTVKNDTALNRAVLVGGPFILMMTGVAFTVGALSNAYFYETLGQISVVVAGGNTDLIMPEFINSAMPGTFVVLFMLTLLAAAMSTLSSQFHTMGTSIGHDLYREFIKKGELGQTINITRAAIAFTILASVVLAYILPISIIARATAIFFGLCAAAFLPMYTGALFWKRMTKEGAIASLLVGTFSSLFWLAFVHKSEAAPLGISKALFGVDTILTGTWTVVDPILVATPIAFIVAIVVSLMTKPTPQEHLDVCYKK